MFNLEKLKEVLVKEEYLSAEDFDIFQKKIALAGISIEVFLVQGGIIEDEKLGKIIAKIWGYPFTHLSKTHLIEITTGLLGYIPEVVAYSQQAIFFNETKDSLKLATVNPDNYEFIKQLEMKTRKRIEIYYITPLNLEFALKHYKGDLSRELAKLVEKPHHLDENVIQVVDLFLNYATLNESTDIHLTPRIGTAEARFRIDGTLYKVANYSLELHERIVSRIKILARLRIDEHSTPQDGRFDFAIKGGKVDLRVSIIPITQGENIVLRLLAQRGKRLSLKGLGFSSMDFKKVKAAIHSPWGMIIAAGPTGSGKTTTMYSAIQTINSPELNIMTIEDPVEYKIEGIQQIQVNVKKDLTFAKGLRSIVRQDPDIILVGEIRDKETADIAINAATTGHLVLSTMHANDAATILVRLIDMGVAPFLVSSAVSVVIAQRLVRKICSSCSKQIFLTIAEIEKIEGESEILEAIKIITKKQDLLKIQFYRASGCKFCNNSGYLGRIVLFEVLEVVEGVQRLVGEKASSQEIRNLAIKQGMIPMIYDGITKALKGDTTLEEIIKSVKV